MDLLWLWLGRLADVAGTIGAGALVVSAYRLKNYVLVDKKSWEALERVLPDLAPKVKSGEIRKKKG